MGRRFWSFRIFCFFFFFLMIRRPPRSTRVRCRQRQMCIRDREYIGEMEEFKGLALYLGGKSMGARLAAQIVAKDVGASGLVFLGYPLHPPGKPEQLRDQPLSLIHISEPTRLLSISYAVFCLKKKKYYHKR